MIHDFTWSSAWGNDNPLIVEIGTGQGENVVAAAAAHPETNFLALEVYDPGVAHTLLLAGKQGLTNIRVAQVNAPELFKVTAAGTVAEVWTFFPDPWPKKKHHKRRIVQKAMAGDIHRALVTDGVWRIATDIEDYQLHRPAGDDRGWFYFWVTLCNQLYWVTGATLGGLIGAHLRWLEERERLSAVIGVLTPLACLLIFGANDFMIPSMIAMLILFVALRPHLDVLPPPSPGPRRMKDTSRRDDFFTYQAVTLN